VIVFSAAPVLAEETDGAASLSSTLHVSSTPPGARVVLGKRDLGTTPFSLAVEPGEHRVHFFFDGYRHRELILYVAPGAEEKAHGSLTPVPESWDDERAWTAPAIEPTDGTIAARPGNPPLRSSVAYPNPVLALTLAIGVPVVMSGIGALIWWKGSDALGSVGGILGVSGVLVGPSAGHLYAGRWGHAGVHVGIRLVLLFATAGGIVAGGGISGASMIPALATGGSLLVGDIVVEVVTTWFAARRARRARVARLGT